MRLRAAAIELAVVAVVFAASAWWGARYTSASLAAGREPRFYQEYFEPAVMMACGRGFVASVPDMAPPLRAFIERRTDRFSCDQIPADAVLSPQAVYQYAWVYLIGTVALAWMVVGISWSALSPLFGVLFAVSVTSVYAIARFGMGRVISVLVAAGIAVSTLHLLNLPHLRDYAKAPFVLLSIVVLAALVTRTPTWKTTVTLGALYGAILGLGYGFRTDLLAGLPVLVATIVGFLPGGVRRFLPIKAAALGAFALAFLVLAWPVLNWVAVKGGCQWHVVLLGLSSEFDQDLGVMTPAVQWGHSYSDSYVYAAVSTYADRVAPEMGRLEFCFPEYDRISSRYLRDIVVRAPADVVTRAYASALRMTELPFGWYSDPIDGYVPWLYIPRAVALRVLAGAGVLVMALAIVALGSANRRLGFFVVFFLMYFGGYPSLQFQNRHYFHLEFMTWWAAGFLLQQLIFVLRSGGFSDWVRRAPWRSQLKEAAMFAAGAAALLLLPLWTLRWYQERDSADLVARLLSAPHEALATDRAADGVVLLPPAPSSYEPPDPREMQYLHIELDPAACRPGSQVVLRYGPIRTDLKRVVDASVDDRPASHVLAPAFWHFRGVEVAGSPPQCLKGIARVTLPPDLGALPTIVLTDEWRTLNLYQEIRR